MPPESASGETPATPPARPRGLSIGPALAILGGVLALGLVAVFTLSGSGGGGSKLPTALGGSLPPAQTKTALVPGQTPTKSSGAQSPGSLGMRTPGPSSTASSLPGGPESVPYTPAYAVGECVDTSGTGASFTVAEANCPGADYRIIHSFPNESGNVNTDAQQCYSINGSDDEFENGDTADGYTLYCLNSLTGSYSPRRAAVDNCLDTTASYEVDCTSTRAAWIVVGRLDNTTRTQGCDRFAGYQYSYYWAAPPPFVLCVQKYKR